MTAERIQTDGHAIDLNYRRQSIATRLRTFKNHPSGTAGCLVLCAYLVVAIIVPSVVPYSPNTLSDASLAGPSGAHLLGTDSLGRDLLSRCLIGVRISITVGFLSSALALVAGSLVGLVSGFMGGITDSTIMRFTDVLIALPALLLAIGVVAAFGSGEFQVSTALALVYFPIFARLARAVVLREREREYVEAMRALGASGLHILFLDISRNVVGPLILQAALSIGFAVILEASLSFLGLGLAPPTPSLGSVISNGRGYMQTNTLGWC